MSGAALRCILDHHYLHRRPPVSHSFELYDGDAIIAVCTFGVPPSRHVQKGACPSNPDSVLELNRLWVNDAQPKNSASWFVSRCLRSLPPAIVVSYADTAVGHVGWVYRALNFFYAGWTDMDRKTPRFDYLTPGKHTRDAFRSGSGVASEKVRRRPKVKYWIVTGSRAERQRLMVSCALPRLNWNVTPVPAFAAVQTPEGGMGEGWL